MRKIIAALQISVDGFIEGPNGELDWAMAEDEEAWRDTFDMLAQADTLILGRVMYPAYEQYWLALLANPAPARRTKSPMHASPIRRPMLSFPEPWIRSHGRRRGSFETCKKSGE